MASNMCYDPGDLITSTSQSPDKALIILNTPSMKKERLRILWSSCRYHVCADGGANRLYDMWSPGEETLRDQYLPELIHGDLDSLRPDVKSYYASRGVSVTQDPDQYSTDFAKSLKQIRAYGLKEESNKPLSSQTNASSTNAQEVYNPTKPFGIVSSVLIFGSISGRVDQGIGLLHEIGRESERYPSVALYLISESSVTFLLPPNVENLIQIKLSEGVFSPNIGILPVYGKSFITTKGLEWDVTDWETEMGGMVSTSNHVFEDEVHICTTVRVLFTVELRDSN